MTAVGEVEQAETTTTTTTTRSTDCGSPRVTSNVSQASSTRKYSCDLCGRMFSRSNTLVTHRVRISTYSPSLSTSTYVPGLEKEVFGKACFGFRRFF